MIWVCTVEPQYVKAFRNGRKTIEIRKRVPKAMRPKDVIAVVEKGSGGKIPVVLRVGRIIICTPQRLWDTYSDVLAIDYESYKDYVEGCSAVVGICCDATYTYDPPFWREQFGILSSPQWFQKALRCPDLEERRAGL